jgi:hypothetical protein
MLDRAWRRSSSRAGSAPAGAVVQGQRQIDARADGDLVAYEQVVERSELVQVRLDVRCALRVPQRGERVEVVEVVAVDEGEQLLEHGRGHRGDLAPVQRHVEGEDPGLLQLVQGVAQGGGGSGRVLLEGGLRGLLSEVAVATAQVAAQRGHVEQVDVAGVLPRLGALVGCLHGRIRGPHVPVARRCRMPLSSASGEARWTRSTIFRATLRKRAPRRPPGGWRSRVAGYCSGSPAHHDRT